MKKSLGVSFLLMLASPVRADFGVSARGTTAAEFLNIAVGARAGALGGAYSAVVDEASAVYWNPAAMTRVEKRSATMMHASYISTSFLDYLAYVHNAGKLGVFGMGFQYFAAGKITQTDETGTDVGSFNPYDMAFSFSYAYQLKGLPVLTAFNGYSFGLSVKLVDSRILNTASAGAVDAGVLSRPYLDDRLRLAFTATNLGGDTMQFDQVKERLPTTIKLGSAYKLAAQWQASFDAAFPKSDRPYVAAGLEHWFETSSSWKFAGRLGFNSQTVGSIDGFTGAAMGFGIAVKGCAMDYGFAPLGGLGQAHRLSLTYNF